MHSGRRFWLLIALGTVLAAGSAASVGVAVISEPTVTAHGWTMYPPTAAELSGREAVPAAVRRR